MDMNNMREVVGGIWETLDKMHKENPDQYKEMVKESMEWQTNSTSQPEACKCIEAVTSKDVTCYINILTWAAVASPDFSSSQPSLPIAGGVQTLTIGHSVFSVCVNPSVMVNTDNTVLTREELDNIVKLVFKFLDQQHPGLNIKSFTILGDTQFKGNLSEITQKLLNLKKGARSSLGNNENGESLVTGTTSSLINQLGCLYQSSENEDSEKINLPKANNYGGRKLIQEINNKPKKASNLDSFGKNLQKAFDKSDKSKDSVNEKDTDIKIRIEETLLTEVKSTRFTKS